MFENSCIRGLRTWIKIQWVNPAENRFHSRQIRKFRSSVLKRSKVIRLLSASSKSGDMVPQSLNYPDRQIG